MTIDKAIEILSDPNPDIDGIMNNDYQDAIKLGIEALKFYKGCGDLTLFEITNLLPGETE